MWALTHIPTGRRLETYPRLPQPNEEYTSIVTRLHDKYGNDWNTTNIRKVQTMAIECKDIWQRDEVTA
jgi:hypothetical protein